MNTITNTNSFSLRRLGEVLKRDLQADKMLYLGLFIVSFLLMTYLQVSHFDSHNHLLHIKHGEISKAIMNLRFEMFSHSLMALLFYIGVMTATFCNPVRKKRKATSYLMMPVTCAERFVSRVLITIFGTLIIRPSRISDSSFIRLSANKSEVVVPKRDAIFSALSPECTTWYE